MIPNKSVDPDSKMMVKYLRTPLSWYRSDAVLLMGLPCTDVCQCIGCSNRRRDSGDSTDSDDADESVYDPKDNDDDHVVDTVD